MRRFKQLGWASLLGIFLFTALMISQLQQPLNAQATRSLVETRCGWFSNPTPANAALYDRDRMWVIAVQGGYQAIGDWPSFAPNQWVRKNGYYGYGCACLDLQANHQTGHVIEIKRASARPLAACRQDPALNQWHFR